MKRKKRLKKSVSILVVLIMIVVGISIIYPKINNKQGNKELPIIQYQKEITTTLGKEIDLLQDVTATSNKQEALTVSVEGTYNFQKEGEYHLFYVAKDKEGNEKKESFTLKVVKQEANEPIDENHFTTSKGFKGEIRNGATYIEGTLIVNKTYALPANFGNGLTEETTEAFNKLKSAALLDGFDIYISSGFRSYERQVTLYNNYVKRDGKAAADTYSARPGHSEHQSGLTFDVNEISDKFHNTPEAKWLSENCYKYGFILRFPNGKEKETGYKYESWHFRYVGEELATKLYNNGDWLTLEGYFGITSEYQD